MFRGSVAQVVPVDGQHAVAHTQLSVTRRHAPLQQVGDVHPVLLLTPHQLNPQLLVRGAFIQHHVDAVVPQRVVVRAVGRVAPGDVLAVAVRVAVGVRAVAVALLSQHGQPEELAGLFERRHGEAVRHVADVDAVYLREQQGGAFKSRLMAPFHLQKRRHTFRIMSPGSRRPSRAMTPSL